MTQSCCRGTISRKHPKAEHLHSLGEEQGWDLLPPWVMWAGILPAQPLCPSKPVLLLSEQGIYTGPGKSQHEQEAQRGTDANQRQVCCSRKVGLTAPLALAAARALAEGGMYRAHLHPPDFLPGSIPALHECMELLVLCSLQWDFFSILKARQQLGGTSCSDILPSTQHRAICSLCNLEPGASGCELTPARALEGIVPSDLPAVQMLLGTVTQVSPSSWAPITDYSCWRHFYISVQTCSVSHWYNFINTINRLHYPGRIWFTAGINNWVIHFLLLFFFQIPA